MTIISNFQRIFLLLLITTSCFSQNNWYVNQETGTDANNGQSPASPFRNIEAATSLLQAADTVFIMGLYANPSYDPDYVFTGNINDPHVWTQENTVKIMNVNGNPGSYITFKPYDENTVLKGDGANILRVTNSSYVRIEGFNIYGEVENISLQTALDLQFVYREAGSSNSLYRVVPGTSPEEVENMTFPVLNSIKRPSYTDTRGLYLSNVHHIDLVNNEVHHVPGNGFRVADCDYINIMGNEVHNTSRKSYSGTHGMVVTKANSMDNNEGYKINIIGNKVYLNYNEIYSWAPSKTIITPKIDEGKGISMQRNTADNGWTHGRFLIANNISYWNGYSGVHANSGDRMDFINNTCFLNSFTYTAANTGDETSGKNIGISASESNDIKIFNNIVVIDASGGGFPIAVRNTENLEVSNNLTFFTIGDQLIQDEDLFGIEENTIEEDPLFLNTDIFDFSLLENSPAIGAANTNEAPTTDFFGNTRNNNPDLGAIEFDPVSALFSFPFKKEAVIFPNPFEEQFIIKNRNLNRDEITIFNLMGQDFTHLIRVNPGINTTINTSRLPTGVFVVKTKTTTNIVVKYE